MGIEIKPRNIRILRTLPISEMTDEEIVKATKDRLNAKAAMLVYDSGEGYVFMGICKRGSVGLLNNLKHAWEEKFGKFRTKEEDE